MTQNEINDLVLGGGLMTIAGKIIWDWLKIRRNGKNPMDDCPYKEDILELKQDTKHLRQDSNDIKINLAEISRDVKWMIKSHNVKWMAKNGKK